MKAAAILLVCMYAVSAQASDKSMKELLADLKGGDSQKRLDALRDLQDMGPEAVEQAVPALAEAITDSEPSVAMLALRALIPLGPKARPALAQMRKVIFAPETPVPVLETGMDVLAAIGPDAIETLPELLKLVKKKAPDTQIKAVRAIGALGTNAVSALPDVLECFESKPRRPSNYEHYDWQKVLAPSYQAAFVDAARSLGPDARALPVFLYALNNVYEEQREPERYKIRLNALKGIEELGKDAPKAVPGLVEYFEGLFKAKPQHTPDLAGKNNIVDLEVCRLLGRLGEAAMDACDVLQRIFEDKKFPTALRNAAWDALNKIDTRDELDKAMDGDLKLKDL